MSKAINRRHFLRGAGIAIALPMLEAMGPSLKAAVVNRKPVKRVVCISNNYGIYKKTFFIFLVSDKKKSSASKIRIYSFIAKK